MVNDDRYNTAVYFCHMLHKVEFLFWQNLD